MGFWKFIWGKNTESDFEKENALIKIENQKKKPKNLPQTQTMRTELSQNKQNPNQTKKTKEKTENLNDKTPNIKSTKHTRGGEKQPPNSEVKGVRLCVCGNDLVCGLGCEVGRRDPSHRVAEVQGHRVRSAPSLVGSVLVCRENLHY